MLPRLAAERADRRVDRPGADGPRGGLVLTLAARVGAVLGVRR
jgi:hypothetical protein